MQHDQPEHDRLPACYRPTVFFGHVISLFFHFLKEKFGALSKNAVIVFSYLYKVA
jgi:hypothetical protein